MDNVQPSSFATAAGEIDYGPGGSGGLSDGEPMDILQEEPSRENVPASKIAGRSYDNRLTEQKTCRIVEVDKSFNLRSREERRVRARANRRWEATMQVSNTGSWRVKALRYWKAQAQVIQGMRVALNHRVADLEAASQEAIGHKDRELQALRDELTQLRVSEQSI
jgi:hypothetical protein